jgi:putative endonuclease
VNGSPLERDAESFLARQGLLSLARNVRYRCGELDLVMLEGATLVFVEVRFRAHPGFGGALASLDSRKQARLRAAAALFLQGHPEHARRELRFDLLAGSGDPRRPHWDWIQNVIEDAA